MHYFEVRIRMNINYINVLKQGYQVYTSNRQYMTNFLTALALLGIMFLPACGNNKEKPAAEEKPSAGSDSASTAPVTNEKNIIFFGNSLTAGYGLDPIDAFPALVQKRIDSLNLPYKVINAGLSGETTAGGKSRIDWILKQPVSIFILELGGNDGLRGIPISETRQNLQTIIDRVKAKNPDVKIVLAGMQVPPNMGQKYSQEFRAIFRELAEKNSSALIPFVLEGVGGVPELNQPDGIHPTVAGHSYMEIGRASCRERV